MIRRKVICFLFFVECLVSVITTCPPNDQIKGPDTVSLEYMLKGTTLEECIFFVYVMSPKRIEVRFTDFVLDPNENVNYLQVFRPDNELRTKYFDSNKPPDVIDVVGSFVGMVFYSTTAGGAPRSLKIDIKEVDVYEAPCPESRIGENDFELDVLRADLPQKAVCSWIIGTALRKRMKITFVNFNFGEKCTTFKLKLYDADHTEEIPCGAAVTHEYISMSDTVGLKLGAIKTVLKKSGMIKVEIISMEVPCPASYFRAEATEKTITIPLGTEPFPKTSECEFIITANDGEYILTTYTATLGPTCDKGSLSVYDGLKAGTPTKICAQTDHKIFSSTNIVTLHFKSEKEISTGTVAIKYKIFEGCPKNQFAPETEKTFTHTLAGHSSFPAPFSCKWIIQGAPNIRIRITNILGSPPHAFKIFDELDGTPTSIDVPTIRMSKGNILILNYESQGNAEAQSLTYIYESYDRAARLCPKSAVLSLGTPKTFSITDDGISDDLICEWFVSSSNNAPLSISVSDSSALTCMEADSNICAVKPTTTTTSSSAIQFKFRGNVRMHTFTITAEVEKDFIKEYCPKSVIATTALEMLTISVPVTAKITRAYICSWSITAPSEDYLEFKHDMLTLETDDTIIYRDQLSAGLTPTVSPTMQTAGAESIHYRLAFAKTSGSRVISISYRAVHVTGICVDSVSATEVIKEFIVPKPSVIYPPVFTCNWTITAPMNHEIRFNLEKIDLANCADGELFYYDGQLHKPTRKICDLTFPTLHRSQQSFIRFRFVTKTTLNTERIKLTYQAVPVKVVNVANTVRSSVTCFLIAVLLMAMVI